MHPVKRRDFLFHIARIFVDKELMVPLRYEAYDWPAKPGEPPPLLESYTYARLKLNPGLTDADFDPNNPQYNFVKKVRAGMERTVPAIRMRDMCAFGVGISVACIFADRVGDDVFGKLADLLSRQVSRRRLESAGPGV